MSMSDGARTRAKDHTSYRGYRADVAKVRGLCLSMRDLIRVVVRAHPSPVGASTHLLHHDNDALNNRASFATATGAWFGLRIEAQCRAPWVGDGATVIRKNRAQAVRCVVTTDSALLGAGNARCRINRTARVSGTLFAQGLACAEVRETPASRAPAAIVKDGVAASNRRVVMEIT